MKNIKDIAIQISTDFADFPELRNRIDKNQNLFENSDGSYLAYALPWERGGQKDWTRGRWHPHLAKIPDKAKENWKQGLGKLGLLTSRTNLIYIAGDFDVLPPEYSHLETEEAWVSFHDRLENIFPDNSVVIRTPSGKAKILIAFRFSRRPLKPNREIIKSALLAVLPSDLYPYLDFKGTATEVVFLPGIPAVAKISSKLPTLKPFFVDDLLPLSVGGDNPLSAASSSHTANALDNSTHTMTIVANEPTLELFKNYRGPLDSDLEEAVRDNQTLERIVRILIGVRYLSEGGFDLPASHLSTVLSKHFFGRECLSRRTIARHLDELERRGLLRPIHRGRKSKKIFGSPNFKWRANRYLASGPLLRAISSTNSHVKDPSPPPGEIEDGGWYAATFLGARFYWPKLNEYLDWIFSQPGLRKKSGRDAHAAKAWSRVSTFNERNSDEDSEKLMRQVLTLIRKGKENGKEA